MNAISFEADLARAKRLLIGGTTLVLLRGEDVLTDGGRGIARLSSLTDTGRFEGGVAADRIVGRAAALLYRLMGVKAVYAEVLSEGGKDVLEGGGIHVEYGTLTPAIINRKGTGPCPMEVAVEGIEDPPSALPAIRSALASLRS